MEAFGASLVPQMVKNLSTMRKTWVQSLGWEDLLEKGMEAQEGRADDKKHFYHLKGNQSSRLDKI